MFKAPEDFDFLNEEDVSALLLAIYGHWHDQWFTLDELVDDAIHRRTRNSLVINEDLGDVTRRVVPTAGGSGISAEKLRFLLFTVVGIEFHGCSLISDLSARRWRVQARYEDLIALGIGTASWYDDFLDEELTELLQETPEDAEAREAEELLHVRLIRILKSAGWCDRWFMLADLTLLSLSYPVGDEYADLLDDIAKQEIEIAALVAGFCGVHVAGHALVRSSAGHQWRLVAVLEEPDS